MLEVNKDTFETEVLQADGLVFVDFWSPKCEPCMALLPDVEAFAERNEGKAKFCKLDTASNKRLSMAQKVMGIPTLAFYKGGEKVFELTKDDIDIAVVEAKLNELL